MYDNLRITIGDQKFFDSLKKYYSENLGKIVTPDHLISSFNKCGKDLDGFMRSFFDGKVII